MKSHTMKKTWFGLCGISLLSLIGVLATAGCGSAEPSFDEVMETARRSDTASLDVLRISADDITRMSDGSNLVVRTSENDQVIVFDPSRGPIDYGRLEIVCPNGQQMHMDVWLLDLAEKQGTSLDLLTAGEFSVARTRKSAEIAFDQPPADPTALSPLGPVGTECCSYTCYHCSDGQWVCYCDLYSTICP